MRRVLILTAAFLFLAAVLLAGCTTTPAPDPAAQADAHYAQAESETAAGNLHTGEGLYQLAQENYTRAGNMSAARAARDRVASLDLMTYEFSANRSAMDAMIASAFPEFSAADRARWLDDNMTVRLTSDNETWYHDDTVSEIFWHDLPLMHARYAAAQHTPFYDELAPLAFAPANTTVPGIAYEGTELLSVPRTDLPANGTLKLWLPLPVETDTQTNVTIISVEPAEYVVSTTGTGADLGLAYLEIPLEKIPGPFLNVSATFRFTGHEARFRIDPAQVQPYNTSSPGYVKYTASAANTVLSPALRARAEAIVKNETNPYKKVQEIYWSVVDTYPYSHPPHMYNEQNGIAETEYFLTTGIGDCGTQSQYFVALLRAAGIPARSVAGYQMILGTPGTHVWSEYYLPGYGWVPSDVTVAEGAAWSYNATADEQHRYKEYFLHDLDPYRYVIQTDTDIPLTPDPGEGAVIFTRNTFQFPDAVCDSCAENPALLMAKDFSVSVQRA